MRLRRGGFTPKISGRPVDDVTTVPLPNSLILPLRRGELDYDPVVETGQTVSLGDPIAVAHSPSGELILPAPAGGSIESTDGGVVIRVSGDESSSLAPLEIERSSSESVREALVRGGVWPSFWSSSAEGIPPAAGEGAPRSIIVNFILTEPFRARGRVIIERWWPRIATGIRFLQRLVAPYGTIELILTDRKHPVAQMMYRELKGQAFVRFHSVPLTYPIENPRLLSQTVRPHLTGPAESEDLWVIDAQGVAAVGACLGEGLPLHERLVVAGGPAVPDPRHFAVRIGTPIDEFLRWDDEQTLMLRGGLLTGQPVADGLPSVGYDDDAYFGLARTPKSELLAFTRPGFGKTSYNGSFAGNLVGIYDRSIGASLRGEERACIACGFCETVCPAGLMPQIIHRYLYRGRTEEAEKVGLERCVDCNLCTYVCPSKIELQAQFSAARTLIRQEREEMRAVAAKAGGDQGDHASEEGAQ